MLVWRRILHRLKSRSSYLFGEEFYIGSKVGVHTCSEENFILVQRESSYLFGGEFYTD
jgi:hypothetical protein